MDFLLFERMVSIPVLIFFYMIGALFCPWVMWRCLRWAVVRFSLLEQMYIKGKSVIWKALPRKQKVRLVLLFVAAFLLAELFWRMLFEYLIAFMQMHDALMKLVSAS